MNPFDRLKSSGAIPLAPKLVARQEPHFVPTANIVVDQSHAWEQDVETLQTFWKWVHDRQPGLIEMFVAQRNHAQ